MATTLLSTKLHKPPLRPNAVPRSRLTGRLDAGLGSHRRLILLSASAGFGKTTLLGEWLAGCSRPSAWLSLDEGDNDIARFLTALFAALRGAGAGIGEGVFAALLAPQPPSVTGLMTEAINALNEVPHPLVLVLDDFHVLEAGSPSLQAIAFLIEHLPAGMHLVVSSRKDPDLPLSRLRVRDQLTELRAAELRFTVPEAEAFFSETMALRLPAEEIAELEKRTEGWIAGLQLAALSLQGNPDTAAFSRSFAGSHRHVADYLIEEVLQRQPPHVQSFLVRTSILDKLCGPLCEAVAGIGESGTGQRLLWELENANLFVIPLDEERRWYRYHHLFAELLKQRLQGGEDVSREEGGSTTAELHASASQWYEDNGLELEAFRHAALGSDVERTARLIEGAGMPLHFRGAAIPVLDWLNAQPEAVFAARPSLWIIQASALLLIGRTGQVEDKLRAAESAVADSAIDVTVHGDFIGHIAAIRATLALSRQDAADILAQSRLALEHLHPGNLPVRTATTWTLGFARQLLGDRAAAGQAYAEAAGISEKIGHRIIAVSATIGLGQIRALDNGLTAAEQTFRRALELAGDPPMPIACEAQLGLALICYERNDLDAAERHGRESLRLARQVENTDRFIVCEAFLARLSLARGDLAGAAAAIAETARNAERHRQQHRMAEVAAVQLSIALRRGDLEAAEAALRLHAHPYGAVKLHLAKGEPAAARAEANRWRELADSRDWADERLKAAVMQALALRMLGDGAAAASRLGEALAMAEPHGFVRLFVDEDEPMLALLAEAGMSAAHARYVTRLMAAFDTATSGAADDGCSASVLHGTGEPRGRLTYQIEPLNERELEVLRLVADGLSNREIADRLYLALSTVKGYNQTIFDKMQVRRRTEAVARARESGLL